MSAFSQITRLSNWGYWDQLDGVVLKNGEVLTLQLPDGTELTSEIHVVDLGVNISDMGHAYQGSNCVAHVNIPFHGAVAQLPLCGLFAKRGTP